MTDGIQRRAEAKEKDILIYRIARRQAGELRFQENWFPTS